MNCSIETINQVDRPTFIDLLGGIYEETPAIAEKVWRDRPFDSVADLHQKMMAAVAHMDEGGQLALIRAHPELGSGERMTSASVQEQAGAGLSEIGETERSQMQALNAAYRRQFGFPFVMAVKGYKKAEIIEALRERLKHTQAQEKVRSLMEINKIARFRLDALLVD